LVALTFLAFAPVLDAGLVNWDDPDTLTNDYSFRGFTREHVEWMFTTNWMGPYQPLAWVSFGIDHALWGFDPAGSVRRVAHYHWTSVAIHALAALALYGLALDLFRIARPDERDEPTNARRFAAFFAALVFAVHPLRVESVAWLTERRDVLCGLFFVLAAWAWIRFAPRAREVRIDRRWRGAALVAAVLAVVVFFQSVDLSGRDRLAWRGMGAIGLALALVLLACSIGATIAAAKFDGKRASPLRLALVCVLFLAALSSKGLAMVLPVVLLVLDVWPLGRARAAIELARGRNAADTRRANEHPISPDRGARSRDHGARDSQLQRPSFSLTLLDLVLEKAPLFALAFVFGALAMWGQASIPGALVSWSDHTLGERILQCFYGLAFYPTKTLVPLHLSPIYGLLDVLSIRDLRFAVPLIVVLAACFALFRFRARVPALVAACVAFAISIAPVLGLTQAGPQLVADRYSYLACIPFALLAGGVLLIVSSGAWRTHATLAALAVLGVLVAATRAQAQLWTQSSALWTHALEIEPGNPLVYLNLAQARIEEALLASDLSVKRAKLTDAQRLLERGLALKENPLLYSSIARVHQVLWEMDPRSSEHHETAALVAMCRAVELAKSTNQYTPDYQLNLGSVLFNAGQVDEAIVELASFLHERPDSFLGRFNLGFALVRKQRFEEAARELEYATRLEPEHVNAWGNLGFAYEGLGDKARAIEAYRRVLAIEPNHATATARLHELTRSDR
jgi:tetratricopeptide (TPR) repeat protein